MDPLIEKLIEGKTKEEIVRLFVNINRRVLEQKKYIKKYYQLRKIHSDVASSMIDYLGSGKYNGQEYIFQIFDDIKKETGGLDFSYDLYDTDDATILMELFLYKTHKKIPSLTEVYLEKNKFRNPEKLKMLHAMKNSYVGLFEVIDADQETGYVTYKDVFTKKEVKIIDISMSSSFVRNLERKIYFYNRIITVDGISFGTGMHCMMTSENDALRKFLKEHRYHDCSDFSRCIMLYDISKKEKDFVVTHHHQYGRR